MPLDVSYMKCPEITFLYTWGINKNCNTSTDVTQLIITLVCSSLVVDSPCSPVCIIPVSPVM